MASFVRVTPSPSPPASVTRVAPRAAALLLVGAALVVMLMPMQGAWFAVIDDHHVAALAGADGQVSAREAAEGARRWIFEPNGRFRPLFWALWHLEAFWAGTDPAWWHRDRLLLVLLTGAALYLAAEAVLPPLLAALAAFTFFCGFQNEIWMRLRVQETYAAVLASVGAAIVARRLARGRDSPMALLPGLVLIGLAGLTKESFAPLLPAALVLVYAVYPRLTGPRKALGRRDRVVLAALALASAATCAAILRVRVVHGPLYLEPTTVSSLAANAWRHLWLITKDSGWPLPLAAAGIVLAWARVARSEWIRPFAWLVAGAVLLLAPQWIVHGAGSVEGRYLVPGSLFAVWASALGLRTLHARRERRPAALWMAFAAASLLWFEAKWVLRDRTVARARALATQEHRASIENVVVARMREPTLAVVFRTEDPYDSERVDSAWWFLAARLGDDFRPYLLATDERRSQPAAALGDYLAALQQARADGPASVFRSWSDYRAGAEQCLEVVFHADPSRSVCGRQVVFPPPDPRLTDGPAAP